MSQYKTIIVHLPDETRAERTLGVAARLAAQHDAHLVGLFVMPPDILSPAFAYARDVMAAGKASLRKRAETIAAQFEAAGPGLQLKKEWRFVEPGPRPVLEVLMSHMRSADLVVLPQRAPQWEDSLLMEFPEEVTLGCGRPTLMVPNAGAFTTVGKRVTVAWNERREAARAVFDALPLLLKADHVRVLWINPEDEGQRAGDVPTAEITKVLSRHGVRVTAAEARGSDIDVGDELLNQVSDDGSDLLVMGAYGRSRFRELIFGGATRQILKQMTVPVLLSH